MWCFGVCAFFLIQCSDLLFGHLQSWYLGLGWVWFGDVGFILFNSGLFTTALDCFSL